MSTGLEIDTLTGSLNGIAPEQVKNLERDLINHIRLRGVLPCSAEIFSQVLRTCSKSNIDSEVIAEGISRDPLLALRLIMLANGTFYKRSEGAQSVLAAINIFGLDKIGEVQREVAETKSYRSVFRGRGLAQAAFQEMLLAILIAERMAFLLSEKKEISQRAGMVSALFNSILVSLAYFRPNIYAGCLLDSMADRKNGLEAQLEKVFGRPLSEAVFSIAGGLSLPEEFKQALRLVDAQMLKRQKSIGRDMSGPVALATVVYWSQQLAHALGTFQDTAAFDSLVREVLSKVGIDRGELHDWFQLLPELFQAWCGELGFAPLLLPDYLTGRRKKREARTRSDNDPRSSNSMDQISQRLEPFMHELRACFRSSTADGEFKRLPQAIFCTISALLRGIGFTRVCIFRWDEEKQVVLPLMLLGAVNESFGLLMRTASAPNATFMPDIQACLQRRAVFQGDPIFLDSWPFVAIPIIRSGRVEGVIYSDRRAETGHSYPLELQEQVVLLALAENWAAVTEDFS